MPSRKAPAPQTKKKDKQMTRATSASSADSGGSTARESIFGQRLVGGGGGSSNSDQQASFFSASSEGGQSGNSPMGSPASSAGNPPNTYMPPQGPPRTMHHQQHHVVNTTQPYRPGPAGANSGRGGFVSHNNMPAAAPNGGAMMANKHHRGHHHIHAHPSYAAANKSMIPPGGPHPSMMQHHQYNDPNTNSPSLMPSGTPPLHPSLQQQQLSPTGPPGMPLQQQYQQTASQALAVASAAGNLNYHSRNFPRLGQPGTPPQTPGGMPYGQPMQMMQPQQPVAQQQQQAPPGSKPQQPQGPGRNRQQSGQNTPSQQSSGSGKKQGRNKQANQGASSSNNSNAGGGGANAGGSGTTNFSSAASRNTTPPPGMEAPLYEYFGQQEVWSEWNGQHDIFAFGNIGWFCEAVAPKISIPHFAIVTDAPTPKELKCPAQLHLEPVFPLKTLWEWYDKPYGVPVKLATEVYLNEHMSSSQTPDKEIYYTPYLSSFSFTFSQDSRHYARLKRQTKAKYQAAAGMATTTASYEEPTTAMETENSSNENVLHDEDKKNAGGDDVKPLKSEKLASDAENGQADETSFVFEREETAAPSSGADQSSSTPPQLPSTKSTPPPSGVVSPSPEKEAETGGSPATSQKSSPSKAATSASPSPQRGDSAARATTDGESMRGGAKAAAAEEVQPEGGAFPEDGYEFLPPRSYTWSATEKPDSRPPLYDQMEALMRKEEFSNLQQAVSTDFECHSWYSVYWEPIFCHNHTPSKTCGTFITYHLLRPPRHLFGRVRHEHLTISEPPATRGSTPVPLSSASSPQKNGGPPPYSGIHLDAAAAADLASAEDLLPSPTYGGRLSRNGSALTSPVAPSPGALSGTDGGFPSLPSTTPNDPPGGRLATSSVTAGSTLITPVNRSSANTPAGTPRPGSATGGGPSTVPDSLTKKLAFLRHLNHDIRYANSSTDSVVFYCDRRRVGGELFSVAGATVGMEARHEHPETVLSVLTEAERENVEAQRLALAWARHPLKFQEYQHHSNTGAITPYVLHSHVDASQIPPREELLREAQYRFSILMSRDPSFAYHGKFFPTGADRPPIFTNRSGTATPTPEAEMQLQQEMYYMQLQQMQYAQDEEYGMLNAELSNVILAEEEEKLYGNSLAETMNSGSSPTVDGESSTGRGSPTPASGDLSATPSSTDYSAIVRRSALKTTSKEPNLNVATTVRVPVCGLLWARPRTDVWLFLADPSATPCTHYAPLSLLCGAVQLLDQFHEALNIASALNPSKTGHHHGGPFSQARGNIDADHFIRHERSIAEFAANYR